MKKILAIAMAAMMMLCVFTACGDEKTGGGDADGTATLKIGGIGPLTGENAIYGTAVKAGMEIAVDEINANGGIAGAQIELKFSDDVSDGETAATPTMTLGTGVCRFL